MAFRARCKCGKLLKIPEKLRGKSAVCPLCQQEIHFPEAEAIVTPSETRLKQVSADDKPACTAPEDSEREGVLSQVSYMAGLIALVLLGAGISQGYHWMRGDLPGHVADSSASHAAPAAAAAAETPGTESELQAVSEPMLSAIPARDDDIDILNYEPAWGNLQTGGRPGGEDGELAVLFQALLSAEGAAGEAAPAESPELAKKKGGSTAEWEAAAQLTGFVDILAQISEAALNLNRVLSEENVGQQFVPTPTDEGQQRPVARGSFAVGPISMHVVALKLEGPGTSTIRDEDLAAFQRLPHLRWVSMAGLRSPAVSERGYSELKHCQSLQRLDMTGQPVSDDFVDVLKHLPNLEALFLGDTRLTDHGAERVATLEKLRVLDVRRTKLSTKGLAQLAQLRNLEYFWFGAGPSESPSFVDYVDLIPRLAPLTKLANPRMLGCFPPFESIGFVEPGFLTETGRSTPPKLSSPSVVSTSLSLSLRSEGLDSLSDKMLRCYVINPNEVLRHELNGGCRFPGHVLTSVSGMTHIRELDLRWILTRDEDLSALRGLTQLQRLHLGHSPFVTTEGLQHLRELPDLQYLNLEGTLVDDSSLEILSRLPALLDVKVSKTRMTKAGVTALSAAVSRLRVHWDGIEDAWARPHEVLMVKPRR